MRKVFIIGTNHVYQFGAGAVIGDATCSSEQEAKFRQLLIRAHRSYGVVAIGEELSVDALIEKALTESVPSNEAHALSLKHRYCDPDKKERISLGIRDERCIRTAGEMSGKFEALIEEEVLAERKKREPYWRDQLFALDAWPVLFVCGSWHVPTFSALLLQSGTEATILEHAWVPHQ